MAARRRLPTELVVLSILAVITRGWSLFTPVGRVWDEVYFEEYASHYFTGVYYVDVHPPLGKLLFALTAWLTRVPVDVLSNGGSFPVMRIFPAVAGVLLVPAVWWLLRAVGASRGVASLGAAMVLGDLGLLVQSRLALMDVPLALCGVGCVAAWATARGTDAGPRFGWLSLAALFGGMAVSIKWTGLASLGLVVAAWLVDGWRTRPPLARLGREGALLLVIPAAVYLGSFRVHLALLPKDGPGSVLLAPEIAASLVGHAKHRAEATPPSFLAELRDLHRVMMSQNLGMAQVVQPAASPWYTWPLAMHRIQLWAGDDASGTRRIELLWNPVVAWGVVGVLALFVALAIAGRAPSLGGAGGLLGAGFLLNFVPYGLIPRPLYLYHYTSGLVFSIAMAALVLGAIGGWVDGQPWSARGRRLYVGALAAILVGFVVFAPLAYGTAQSARGFAARRALLER